VGPFWRGPSNGNIEAGRPLPKRYDLTTGNPQLSRPPEGTIRIITWNCCRARFTDASAALEQLDPSVGVLQEARRPALVPPRYQWTGPNPRNGLAIYAPTGTTVRFEPELDEGLWSILPARSEGAVTLQLLVVWAQRADGYIAGLNRALDVYSDFLRNAPTVILGDFNANAIWDSPRRPTDFSRTAGRMRDEFGLTSAYHAYFGEAFGAETRATYYFWWKKERPFHIDYCFVPSAWVSQIARVDVVDTEPWSKLSDHRPLVVDMNPIA
jgi:exodeoxyribonuclease-3